MGQRDHPRPHLDGATCTACGAPVPTGRIRFLARRDDVAFVELVCTGCGSDTLGLLMTASEPDLASILDVASDRSGTTMAGSGARTGKRPIGEDDVIAIRRDLAAWEGDLVGWLEALERQDPRGSVADA
jgi:hypothetical protein